MRLKLEDIKLLLIGFGIAVVTLLILFMVFKDAGHRGNAATDYKDMLKNEIKYWTCSMHPQIKLPEPGKCPICAMDLIPLESGGSADIPERVLKLSPAARELARIETAAVEKKFVEQEVRMVGKIDYDETRVFSITSWVSGRIDRLFVDYTGIPVKKGDHMVEIYSPELLSAQEEYLQALKSIQAVAGSNLEVIKETSENTLVNVREKLKLLGINDEQIQAIETSGIISNHMNIYAPKGGIVISKEVKEGAYVKTGTVIYTIADLTNVWIQLDAYETDIKWLRYGQTVELETESYPGDLFQGKIAFIYPVLNDKTRTIKVRVNVDNREQKLKPGMFVRAKVKVKASKTGVVLDADLLEKWICPMHPEIIKDTADKCTICGMNLERLSDLGYILEKEVINEMPLVIPVTAVLRTGKRAIVYVELPAANEPTFEGREIVLGPRAGDYYIVKEGLSVGERVVVKGNFKIDSALQIEAKPSMMSPAVTEPEMEKQEDVLTLEVPDLFLESLSPLYEAYLSLASALTNDNFVGAKDALNLIKTSLSKVDMKLLSKQETHMAWMKIQGDINNILAHIDHLKTLDDIRNMLFKDLSAAIISMRKQFGSFLSKDFEMFCPMADGGKGATWLQADDKVKNPYYGQAMLGCGEVKQSLMKTTK